MKWEPYVVIISYDHFLWGGELFQTVNWKTSRQDLGMMKRKAVTAAMLMFIIDPMMLCSLCQRDLPDVNDCNASKNGVNTSSVRSK